MTSSTTPPTTVAATAATWPAAVLFDCDGTLADTERLSQQAWTTVLGRRGFVPDDADFAALIGHAWPRSYDHFSTRLDLGDRDVFREEVRAEARRLHDQELALFPDAIATVVDVADAGVPVAVVSSSQRAHVLRCLEVGGVADRVAVIVGADDVEVHKPDPAPYLAAAEVLGVDVAACTAVEDTATGIASARAAGAFTVAVDRGAVARATLDDADRVVDLLSVEALLVPTPRAG